eukprot:scaffold15652_cov151-Isochrysis_galbana.AAC.5
MATSTASRTGVPLSEVSVHFGAGQSQDRVAPSPHSHGVGSHRICSGELALLAHAVSKYAAAPVWASAGTKSARPWTEREEGTADVIPVAEKTVSRTSNRSSESETAAAEMSCDLG